ncbi:hypothetical protein V501_01355 [Pseudogymnoascus sp. VKM F-4519 (FW-2642)]|nr:hypothetical protein V501_01355 [Pseudogymnoascus sp. VKM F-4519 (FW-2642)]
MILQEETFLTYRERTTGLIKTSLGNACKEWEYTDASYDGSTASALIEKPRSPLATSTPLWLQSTNPVSPKAPRSPQFYTLSTTLTFSGELSPQRFVDDYIAWVIRPNLNENTSRLQEEFILRITEWEKSSGATFEVQKT